MSARELKPQPFSVAQQDSSRLDIHHPPLPLQRAEADNAANILADAAGIRPGFRSTRASENDG
jgi:hypothetical protein